MNKLAAVKLVTRIIVGAGTTTISNSIIRNNVAPSNKFELVTVGAASLVIGSMAAGAVKSHTDAQIDAIAAVFTKDTAVSPEAPIVA